MKSSELILKLRLKLENELRCTGYVVTFSVILVAITTIFLPKTIERFPDGSFVYFFAITLWIGFGAYIHFNRWFKYLIINSYYLTLLIGMLWTLAELQLFAVFSVSNHISLLSFQSISLEKMTRTAKEFELLVYKEEYQLIVLITTILMLVPWIFKPSEPYHDISSFEVHLEKDYSVTFGILIVFSLWLMIF